MNYTLSILIAGRNEMFFSKTVQDCLEHTSPELTNIICIIDGTEAGPPIPEDPRVTIVKLSEPAGQRGAINLAAKLANNSKYICKLDAHCSLDQDFDKKIIETNFPYEWTVIPAQKNLHAFNWRCNKCGHERYQGPTPTSCEKCDNTTNFERHMIWQPRPGTTNNFWRFDNELHFQYWSDFKNRSEGKDKVWVPTMSCLGACWILHRDRFYELGEMDMGHGGSAGWGQMGTELGCKSWLSGGALMTFKKSWFAHMFRTQGGDFGFPYKITGKEVGIARKHSKNLWIGNNWPKQKYPFSWLLEKFWPIPGWTEDDYKKIKEGEKNLSNKKSILSSDENNISPPSIEHKEEQKVFSPITAESTKGIVYYTDNRCQEKLSNLVIDQLLKISKEKNIQIVFVSLKPIDVPNNIVLSLDRGYLTMFKQILTGIKNMQTDIIYLAEHDVCDHSSRFNFVPPDHDHYFYQTNTWQVRLADLFAARWDCRKQSQLCGTRNRLLEHYTERCRRVEAEGFSMRMGFEPGTHNRPEKVDFYTASDYKSSLPSVDIRHAANLTRSRWNPSEFRSQRNCQNWKEGYATEIEELSWAVDMLKGINNE